MLMLYRVILSLICISSALFAQSSDPDYEILAKHSILENTITRNLDEWTDSATLNFEIKTLFTLLETRSFAYYVRPLWKDSAFEAVTVVDNTNRQSYSNQTIFIINRTSRFQRYYRVDPENIARFITNEIVQKRKMNDTLRQSCISLYNSVYFIYDKSNYHIFNLINSESDSAFSSVDKLIRPITLNEFFKEGLTLNQYRAYIRVDLTRKIREYWTVRYVFDPISFHAEHELLLKERIE